MPVKEIILSKVAGLQHACLLKNEFLHRYFPRVLNEYFRTSVPDQFPVAGSIKY